MYKMGKIIKLYNKGLFQSGVSCAHGRREHSSSDVRLKIALRSDSKYNNSSGSEEMCFSILREHLSVCSVISWHLFRIGGWYIKWSFHSDNTKEIKWMISEFIFAPSPLHSCPLFLPWWITLTCAFSITPFYVFLTAPVLTVCQHKWRDFVAVEGKASLIIMW